MKSLNLNKRRALIALLGLTIWASSTYAAETNDRIVFDKDRAVVESKGDGYQGTWYYYPYADEYIMWFRNTKTCAPDYPLKIKLRVARVVTEFSEDDPNDWYNLNIHHGWTTPVWSTLGHSTPPLPGLMSSSTEQSIYLDSHPFISMDPNEQRFAWIRVQETRATPVVEGYNPEWLYIAVRGRNVGVFSHFDSYCDDGTVVDPTEAPYGACCNRQSGACYMSQQANCPSPNEWLGAGTSCDDCTKLGAIWDYGDAPSSYPVLLDDNGATHVIQEGVFLGSGVTAESDGKPSASATGDEDDGVILPERLTPGTPALIKVTASTYGVLNAWLDVNRDGQWDAIDERVFTEEPLQPGQNILSMPILASAANGTSYVRFRFSTAGGIGPTGQATNGEVEDYQVRIGPSEAPPAPAPGPSPVGVAAVPGNQYDVKWHQSANNEPGPDIIGWPEKTMFTDGPILADDWLNQGSDPVIGIRWWGAFADWTQKTLPSSAPQTFHIGIWTDDYYLHVPNTLIWEEYCTGWSWAYAGALQDPQGKSSGDACFEFVQIMSQDKWFSPTVDSNTRYWISISPVYDTYTPGHAWGWVTRESQYGEAAILMNELWSISLSSVRLGSPNPGDIIRRGVSIMHPQDVPWDMSFNLISSRPGKGSGGNTGAVVDDQVKGNDLNGDGVVDIQDISILMRMWLDD